MSAAAAAALCSYGNLFKFKKVKKLKILLLLFPLLFPWQ